MSIISAKKSIINIELKQLSIIGKSISNNKANSYEFNNRRKSMIKVRSLMKFLSRRRALYLLRDSSAFSFM